MDAAMLHHSMGANSKGNFGLSFDPRVRLEFHGSKINSDGVLLLFRELNDTLGLHDLAGQVLRDTRTGNTEEIIRRTANNNPSPPLSAPSGTARAAPEQIKAEASGACFSIFRVNVEGATLLQKPQLSEVTSRFEARCLGIAELNAVMEQITFAYIDKGYIAARSYLPEQDLSDGQLEIVVVEGFLEGIDMPQGAPEQIATAFPGMVGRPVNLRDVEQGLDQIRRLPSVDATMELQAGLWRYLFSLLGSAIWVLDLWAVCPG